MMLLSLLLCLTLFLRVGVVFEGVSAYTVMIGRP